MRSTFVALGLSCGLFIGCTAETSNSAKKAAGAIKDAAAKAGDAAKDAMNQGGKIAKEAAEAAKAKFTEVKDAFKKKAEEQLGGFDTQLAALKAKIKDAPADTKAKLEEKAKTAENLMKEGKEHLSKLGDLAEDNWGAFQDKCKEISEKIKKALE